MNAYVPASPQAAEPRRYRISAKTYRAMWAAGVFPPDAHLELIDGEVIEMPADGHRTIEWNAAINRWLIENLDHDYVVVPDKSLEVGEFDEPKPDFWVFDAALRVADVTPANVLLIIEIADSTLRLDLRKAEIYGRAGVREYWILDVERRRTLVHRLRGPGGYGEPLVVEEEGEVRADLLPGLVLRIADLSRLG